VSLPPLLSPAALQAELNGWVDSGHMHVQPDNGRRQMADGSDPYWVGSCELWLVDDENRPGRSSMTPGRNPLLAAVADTVLLETRRS
jgi:hypothetical protein